MFYQTVLLMEFQNTEITNVGSSMSISALLVMSLELNWPLISFTLGSREQGQEEGSWLLNRAWPAVTINQHVKITATVTTRLSFCVLFVVPQVAVAFIQEEIMMVLGKVMRWINKLLSSFHCNLPLYETWKWNGSNVLCQPNNLFETLE
jgi:hypothetical protein